MKPVTLTQRERYALQRIAAFIAKQEQPPTLFEIGLMLDTTRSTAQDTVDRLAKKGFIKVEPGVVRGIVILKEA